MMEHQQRGNISTVSAYGRTWHHPCGICFMSMYSGRVVRSRRLPLRFQKTWEFREAKNMGDLRKTMWEEQSGPKGETMKATTTRNATALESLSLLKFTSSHRNLGGLL